VDKIEKHLHPQQDAGKKFYQEFQDKGKVVMLNLLKFKDKADYTNLDALKPDKDITGKEAYKLYSNGAIPELEKIGSRVIFYGKSNHFLIGPEHESWDAVMLVEHPSVEKFMAFAKSEDYLAILGHRTAALEDSRLLPISIKST